MSKQELVKAIANEAGITAAQAETAYTTTFETIKRTMVSEGNCAVPDFGNFITKIRAARKGRNPATGAEIDIPEALVASFKPATKLKTFVKESATETAS